jgi:glycine/D-amino acid oxidase-like deaminating enzyme/nitrite reductase/ring-hydroxylating ferredoxin subunit
MVEPTAGQSVSVWMATASVPDQQPLTHDARADVCVVGAGIAGMTTAYLLARAGRSVILLDDGPVAGGQTQKTTAHLSNALDDRFSEVEKVHGEEGIRLAADSHTAAIDRIEKIALEEGIACDFLRLDGYLFAAPGQSPDILTHERAAAHRAGLTDVELLDRAPLPFDTGRCLRFPRQGQFHPLKYLAGLARAIQQRGGRIHTHTHATAIEGGEQARVATRQGPVVTAEAVVVATNVPVNDLLAIHTKQAPYMTYAIGARVLRGSVTRALYWDTLESYHYVRLQPGPDGDVLIVGGEDHKAGQVHDEAERFGRLEAWARQRFPMLGAVAYRWSGMVMETIDGLAFIGRNPGDKDNVFIATGDSGMGMTHGTIAGMLLTDLILGRDNPWAKLYDPSRKPLRGMAGKEFLVENLNVARQYADWLTPGEVSSVTEVRPGTGAVLRRGLSKFAVYRDEQGRAYEYTAVCPHLGCIVDWNSAEQTWDCPCHGSRFDRFGRVVNGPANRDLEPGAPRRDGDGWHGAAGFIRRHPVGAMLLGLGLGCLLGAALGKHTAGRAPRQGEG